MRQSNLWDSERMVWEWFVMCDSDLRSPSLTYSCPHNSLSHPFQVQAMHPLPTPPYRPFPWRQHLLLLRESYRLFHFPITIQESPLSSLHGIPERFHSLPPMAYKSPNLQTSNFLGHTPSSCDWVFTNLTQLPNSLPIQRDQTVVVSPPQAFQAR